MNFLNFSDSESRPALKLISLAFVVFNAVILALLIFGPGRITSGTTQNGADPGTGPVQSASAGYTSGQESQGSYNGEDSDEETREEDDDRYRGGDSEDDDRSNRDYSENAYARDDDDDRNDRDNTDNALASDRENEEDEDDDDQRSSDGPVLELTDDHVTLHVGDEFNFYSYIKTMRDRDGSELSRYIHLSGNVDTYTPGDYRITYRITSPIDGESTSKDLLVTVRP